MLNPRVMPRRSVARARPAALVALLAAALLLLVQTLPWQVLPNAAFVAAPGFRAPALSYGSSARSAHRVALAADDGEVVDAEMVDDEEPEEEEEGEAVSEELAGLKYPPEAYMEYAKREQPPQAWYDRRVIHRRKINQMFMEQQSKPVEFFPIDLRPGDTIRLSFLDPTPGEEAVKGKMREVQFDGVILNFRGKYHTRTVTMRAMVGKGQDIMGMELNIPIHSPLVTNIEVLRRGFIGRNKNAYFVRGLIGKKNQIPEDKERTKLDSMYEDLRLERRFDEIPKPEYPLEEFNRYPLPQSRQDRADWDESKYNPDDVDQRSEYEYKVIGRATQRIYGKTRKG